MSKPRSLIKIKDRWNVEAMCPTFAKWESDFAKANKKSWPELEEKRGTLSLGAQLVADTLALYLEIDEEITRLFTYAHLRHDEDIVNAAWKGVYDKMIDLYQRFHARVSWLTPELLSLPPSIIDEPVLSDYRFYLEKILRLKDHVLSAEEEKLLAESRSALEASHRAFSALNDADMPFPPPRDEDGNEQPLTHGSFSLYLHGKDRVLRKNAFDNYLGSYAIFRNTLCELLNGKIQAHVFDASARNYSSCLEAALYPNQIDTGVYHSLIDAVRDEISALHDAMSLRKEILSYDSLHLYDLHVPLTDEFDMKVSYDEAVEWVVESVAPLGADYQAILRKGLTKDRWVDRYENKNKRSGAYSSGAYGSMPYILLNYKGLLRDVFTLAHEAGHSMHSHFANNTQPYCYADYSIFLAEVASTFHEELLQDYLMKKFKAPQERLYLLNQSVEDIRGTLFRQTQFAEFELALHTRIEEGRSVTPEHLSALYLELTKAYYGPSITIDRVVEAEWARIPHFYYNFYVYQYATGVSAAMALAKRVLHKEQGAVKAYIAFLSGGSSLYPLKLLKQAGVDMTTETPVKEAIAEFRSSLLKMKELHNKLALSAKEC